MIKKLVGGCFVLCGWRGIYPGEGDGVKGKASYWGRRGCNSDVCLWKGKGARYDVMTPLFLLSSSQLYGLMLGARGALVTWAYEERCGDIVARLWPLLFC